MCEVFSLDLVDSKLVSSLRTSWLMSGLGFSCAVEVHLVEDVDAFLASGDLTAVVVVLR